MHRLIRRLPVRAYWLALAIFAVLAVLWLVLLAPRLLAPTQSNASLRDVTDPVQRQQLVDERLSLQNNVRTTLLQGVGGAVLLFGVYFTFRQFQLNQEGHITDRFSHAIDQLGNEKLAVRVGGIAALGRIARDSAKDHEPVMESLAAFVRERSNELRQSQEAKTADDIPHLGGDLQAAATILGYRPESRQRAESRRISLRGASLGRVHLRKAHYEGMAVTNADFRRSQLTGIYLNYALARGARFEKAILEEAHLNGAFLVGADLRYAILAGANFSKAWLFAANFEGAQVNLADLAEGYFATEPILDWLKETLGDSPWRWSALRESLDIPSDAALSVLQDKWTQFADRAGDKEHMQEGLRQIGFFLENKLEASNEVQVHDARIAEILEIRGLAPDTPSVVGRDAEGR